jgi:hypothetical protein
MIRAPATGEASAARKRRVRWAARLAWMTAGPLAVLVGAAIVEALATGDVSPTTIMAPLAGVMILATGAILVTRLPGNRIGWLLWAGGVLLVTTRITQGLSDHGLTSNPGSIPGAIWIAWVNAWVGLPALVLIPVFLPLVFPSGRLPSRRWRIVVAGSAVAIATGTAVDALSPFPAGTYPSGVSSPLTVRGPLAHLLAPLGTIVDLILFLALVLGLGSLAIRYWRSTGIERQQMKWVAFSGSIAIIAFIAAALGVGYTTGPLATIDSLAWTTGFAGLALLPVTIGIAILRYRLYEIDRLVSRTISWTLMSAIVGGLFTCSILVLQSVLAPVTRTNTIAVAGSTLMVAGLFQPLRGWVQRIVDRRFNRARVDAERIAAAFAGRLRDEVDLNQLGSEITSTVARTIQPASVSLWLRP